MINIKIGNKTIQKAGIIYISPDGNDTNNGTKESPVKTYEKALSLCGNNYAIFFMKGTHTLNFFKISNDSKSYALFTNSFKTSNNNYIIYNFLLFSNLLETIIIWNFSYTMYYSDIYFLCANGSDANLQLYNLNIEITINLNSTPSSYFYFLKGGSEDVATINITNCLIKCNVYNPYQSYSWGKALINNSIIYLNTKESSTYATYTFNDSILYNLRYESRTNNNSKELEVTGSNFATIEKEAKALCTDTMGIYSGDYSEWYKAKTNNQLKELNSIQDAYDSDSSYKLDDIKNNLSLLDKLKYIIIRFIKTVKY